MPQNRLRFHWESLLAGGLLAICGIASTGCQVDIAGQTLPSPHYLKDDLQHFSTGPEFKLSNEAAAMKSYQADATGEGLP